MSIFKNPDFLDFKPLDLENKLYLPTRELYSNLDLKLNEFHQHIKTVLFDVHAQMAAAAQQFYARPVETASQWSAQIVDYGTTKSEQLSEVYLPKVEAFYERMTSEATRFGRQSGEFWQAFYDHPQATVATLVEPISSYANQALEVSEDYLISIYSAILDLIDLLMEQPSETMEAVYQNTLAALLDVYYQLISLLLTMM